MSCLKEYQPLVAFRGPKNSTYVLAAYPGCDECENPPTLDLFNVVDPEVSPFDEAAIADAHWVEDFWEGVDLAPLLSGEGVAETVSNLRARLNIASTVRSKEGE